jgi:hypothetical protein
VRRITGRGGLQGVPAACVVTYTKELTNKAGTPARRRAGREQRERRWQVSVRWASCVDGTQRSRVVAAAACLSPAGGETWQAHPAPRRRRRRRPRSGGGLAWRSRPGSRSARTAMSRCFDWCVQTLLLRRRTGNRMVTVPPLVRGRWASGLQPRRLQRLRERRGGADPPAWCRPSCTARAG